MTWAKFFSIPETATIWDLINSNAMIALLGAYFSYAFSRLNKKTDKLSKKADLAQETAEDARSVVDAAGTVDEIVGEELPLARDASNPTNESDRDYRIETKSIVDKVKVILRDRAKSDPDGRHKRTYGSMPDHLLSVLAVQLEERKRITRAEMTAAVEVLELWRRYSRGPAARLSVPEAVFGKIQHVSQQLGA